MNRIVVCILTIVCLLVPVIVSAESAEQAYRKARDDYHSLQNSSRKQMYREQWERVYGQFEAVYERFPASKRGGDALYMCGKTTAGLYAVSRIKPDALRAVELFEQLAESYPDSSLADDALLQAGQLLEEALGEKQRAYATYDRLTKTLPGGDMVNKAKARMAALADYAPPPEITAVEKIVRKADQPLPTSSGATAAPAGGGSLTGVRYWSNPGYTRIVLDVSNEARFSTHYLVPDPNEGNHPRLYIDIEKTGLDASLKEPTVVDDGLLRRIRTGLPQSDTVRVVLDLDSIGDYKVFPLNDPWRIVIDIAGDKVPELKRHETEITALPGSGNDAIAKVLKEAPKDQQPLHIPKAAAATTLRRIVVDAGHGGKDPGAVGPSGVLEKTVTLALAKALAAELTRQIGCEVILTRSGDVYLPLEERTAIANKVGADLFISLHANANSNRKAYGIETYYLNFSKNDKAAAVAARENGTTLKQVSDLELILFDLMANAKINESSRLATEIQESLVQRISKKYSDVRDLGVRQGPFYVLLGATMPSVLVETAFLSHPREEKRLTSSAFQKSAAEAIAGAIKNYAVNNKLIAAR
ncbi:MAG: N-acetylmuramoyl-L-alanine amidase [Desulfuromonadales bacterium]|jgi:N-acetylmuramoyl-L-alanine amidase|nr:N-acetylmuramoyl-L-alanine amidase [Desulfuromonadales bacterium]